MKWLVFIGIFLVSVSVSAQAEMMYVNDILEITLRTGPGVDRKIIAMLQSDQVVEVISMDPEWSQVKLPDGREGWVVSRFLTSKLPNRIALERLKQKHNNIERKASSLVEENNKYKEENGRLGSELAKNLEALSNLEKAYEKLKTESADFLTLKSDYSESTSRLAEQTEKAKKFEEELKEFRLKQNIKWFLSGAGVLLVGIIIGYSTKRERHRSSLL
ncbi:MAG TPA: TIGR04211 family SH3 domain-containing protein [Desulfobacterales bacterium]|nr:TIGR04211 family SH3 domain-containing protein [Desulfobacterales bacterium]